MENPRRRMTPLHLSGLAVVDYCKELSDEVDWLAEGFMVEPSITMIYATDGIGKSIVGIQSALEFCSAFPIYKTLPVKRELKVIYVMAERSIKEPMKRIKKMMGDPDYGGTIKFENFAITTEFQGRDLSNEKNANFLMGVLTGHASDIGGCDIVIFDPLYALVKGDLKEDQSINAVFNFFRRVGSELGANVIFFHHENRGTKEIGASKRTGQDFYGNKFISGLCTAVWHMVRDEQDTFKTYLINEKDTESTLIPKIALSFDPEHGTVRGDVSSSPKAKDILIDAFLKKHKDSQKPFTQADLFRETGIHLHPVSERRLFSKLIKSGDIKLTGKIGSFNTYESV